MISLETTCAVHSKSQSAAAGYIPSLFFTYRNSEYNTVATFITLPREIRKLLSISWKLWSLWASLQTAGTVLDTLGVLWAVLYGVRGVSIGATERAGIGADVTVPPHMEEVRALFANRFLQSSSTRG